MRFFGRCLCANFLSGTSARWQFSGEAVRITRKLTGTSFSSVASIDQSRNEKGPPLRERLAAGLSCPFKEHLDDTARATARLSMSWQCGAGFSCRRGTGRDCPAQGIECSEQPRTGRVDSRIIAKLRGLHHIEVSGARDDRGHPVIR